jgi:hypothetical protein
MQLRKNHAAVFSIPLLRQLLNKIVYKIFTHVVIYQEMISCINVISKNLSVNDHMEE